ncbi:MAG: energy-coupling factor transporter transmembrane component T [Clostridiaceae bacterium]
MGLVDYQPGTSYLHTMDPRVKIIALLYLSIVVFMVKSIFIVIVMLGVFSALWSLAQLSWKAWWGFAKVVLSIMALIIVLQLFFYGKNSTAHFILGLQLPDNIGILSNYGLKWEGLEFGILLTIRFLALIILMPMIIKTTTINQLSLGMVRLGLPYKIAYMTTTSLNIIPTFQEEIRTIMDAQKLRGMTVFEEGKKWEKFKAYPALVVPMVIGAMRRAQQMGVAMDTRAFGCSKQRTYIENISMQKSDWLYLAAAGLIGAALIAANAAVPPSIVGMVFHS